MPPALIALLALVILDVLYVFLCLDGGYSARETLANAFTMMVADGLRRLTFVWRLGIFSALHALAPVQLPLTVGWVALCYVLIDLTYYCKHRFFLHGTGFGWSIHSAHHSSTEVNISTSARTSWIQRVLGDFFFAPLVLLGFPPLAVMLLMELNMFTLTWVHTRIRGRFGLLEYVLNTPSAHRVHHAVSRRVSSCNYGAHFLVWDRLLGTYTPEPDTELVYGIEEGPRGHNPFRIQFLGMWEYLRALARREPQQLALPEAGRDR